MNDAPDTEELIWPTRWRDSPHAPPLAGAFVRELDELEPARRSDTARRGPPALWVSAAAAFVALAAAAALYVGTTFESPPEAATPLVPATSPGDIVAATPADTVAATPADTVAPSTVAAEEPSLAPTTEPASSVGAVGAEARSSSGGSRAPAVESPTGETPESRTPATNAEPAALAATGRLSLDSSPRVPVFVDGTLRGRTPVQVEVFPGEHTVRWYDPDQRIDHTERFVIGAGETTRVWRNVAPPVAAPSVAAPATPAASPYDDARACALTGDHACVVDRLRGHASTAREFELLIASLRSLGHDRDVETNMRLYLSRFPTGRQAAAYRQYLVAHAGR